MGALKEFGVNLVANVSGFQRSMAQATAASKKFKKDLSESLGSVARLSAPLGAFAVNAVRAAVSFEDAFAGVRKTVQNASEEDFANLKKAVLELSTVLPASANEISKVMENAAQLGVTGNENLLKFTKTMIDLSASTNIMADEGSIALAQFAAATQMPIENIDRLGSTISGLGNITKTTEADILEFATRISGTGKAVGLTEAQIVSFGAGLASVGLNAEAGSTSFNKFIKELNLAVAKGGDGLKQFAAVADVSAEKFAKAYKKNAADAIMLFLQGLADIKESGGNVALVLDKMGYSEARISDMFLRSAGGIKEFSNALENGNRFWDENTALVEEAAKRYGTTASQTKMAYNEFNKLSVEIGVLVIPTFRDMLAVVRDTIVVLRQVSIAVTDFAADAIVATSQWAEKTEDLRNALGILQNPLGAAADKAAEFTAQLIKGNKESKVAADTTEVHEKAVKGLGSILTKLHPHLEKAGKAQKEVTKETKGAATPTRDLTGLYDKLGDKTKELEKAKKEAAKKAKEFREELERSAASAYSAVESSEKYAAILKQVKDGVITQADAHQKAAEMTQEYMRVTQEVEAAQRELEKAIADVNQGLADPSAVNEAIGNLERLEKAQEELLKAPKEKGGFWEGLLGGLDLGAIGQVKEGAFENLGQSISSTIVNALISGVKGGFNRESLSGVLSQAGGAVGAAFGVPFADAILKPITDSLVQFGKSTAGTIKSLLTVQTFGLAAFVPDSVFEDMFGESAGTAARKAADKFFADAFDKERLTLVINGQLQQITDLQFTGNQDGGGIFGSLEEDAREAFEGIGMAAEMSLGIATDLGVNLANVFANNVGGELNNLQILLETVGLTAEQLKTSIVKAFRSGDISATQALKTLESIEEVTKKGIPGSVGATDKAFENLINSAGRGVAFIDAIGDLGAEALEKGTQGLEGLKQELIASGKFSQEEIEKLFSAIASVGITSLEELRDISDETAIQLGANLEGQDFGFSELSDDLKDIANTLDRIPKAKDVTVKIKADISPEDRKAIALVTDGEIGGSSSSSSSGEFQEIQSRSAFAGGFARSVGKPAAVNLATSVKEQIEPSFEVVEKRNEKAGEKVKKTWLKKFGDIFGNKAISKAFSNLAGDITKETTKLGQAIAGNVNKNLADMQLLLHETGVSVGQLGKSIVDEFLKKTLSATEAAEALKQIAAIEQIGDPTKEGAIGEAIEKLRTQGGKGGFEALNAIKGVIQEASEVIDAKKSALEVQIEGVREKAEAESRTLTDEERSLVDRLQKEMNALDSLDALRTEMIATGKATENDINAIYIAMKDAGLESIKAIVNATDKQLIPALAKLQQMSFFKLELPEAIEDISLDEEGNVVAPKRGKRGKRGKRKKKLRSALGNAFGHIKDFASSGLIQSGYKEFDIGSVAEEGPESLMPLGRMKDGKLGVHVTGRGEESITINVNATDVTLGRKVAEAVRDVLDTRNRPPGRAF